ncbi:CopD family protein [Herbaspirillum sp. HC18]|nr:CopD family protein [Herbaspirillum sp. HC18]
MLYLWVKALHIFFVVGWFAGLFYLPRIYVNLAMETDKNATARLLTMSRKLYRFMTLLEVPALVLGLWLWLGIGVGKGSGWIHAKLAIVVFLVFYHHGCGVLLRKFENGTNTHSHKWYRWFNEAPTIGLLLAVILVVLKPF